MSYHLTSLVWEIQFPTQGQKLVMLRLADYANDEGDSVYPKNDEVARQCGLTKRGVQYILRGLDNAGLLKVVHEGGGHPGDTNRRKIDVDLVIDLALANRTLEGAKESLQVVDKKGELGAPYILRRVHQRIGRVNSVRDMGEPECTQTLRKNQLELPDACASARDGSRTTPAVDTTARPMIELTPTDPSWTTWMAEIEKHGRTDLADAAHDTGKLRVTARWPTAEKGLQELITAKSRKPRDISSRIIGEGDAA